MGETGVIRITRHPQMVGQVMWSAAHLAMVGTTFTLLTMILLVGHHVFAVWNGDRRLKDEHGERFELIRERTSVPLRGDPRRAAAIAVGLLEGALARSLRADRRRDVGSVPGPPLHAGGG